MTNLTARKVNFDELPGYSNVKPDWYLKLIEDFDEDFEDDDLKADFRDVIDRFRQKVFI